MKNLRIEALIISIGLMVMGLCVKLGFDALNEDSRTVTVKGLAEMEVSADKVTWPLSYDLAGDDLGVLYNNIAANNDAILSFLKSKGLEENEVTIGSPSVYDAATDRYRNNEARSGRYKLTMTLTVSSSKVALIRQLSSEVGELMKQGIVISTAGWVNYEYTGLNSIKPRMIAEATKNARAAAEQFAKDSGSEIGHIKTAYQGQFQITNRDSNTPHIKHVRVVSTIVYTLKN